MKRCSRCKESKKINEFYLNQHYCKECFKEYARAHPEVHRKSRKKWLMKRFGTVNLRKTKYAILTRAADKKYQKNKRKENPGYKTLEYAEYRKKNPEKVKAHMLLNYAIRKGKIERSPCVDCGATHMIHGHHPNYTKPYEVIWVCSIHHKNYHKN